MKKGAGSRPPQAEWRRLREEVLERDAYQCQECMVAVGETVRSTGPTAEIHHKTPLSEGGTNDVENLTVLCPDCHRQKHGGISLDKVLNVFDTVRGPVVTSADVAEAFDCTTETARRKLKRLRKRGTIDGRKAAGEGIYWRVEGMI